MKLGVTILAVAAIATCSVGCGSQEPQGSPADLAITTFDATRLAASMWAITVQAKEHPDELRAAALRHLSDSRSHAAALYALGTSVTQGASMDALRASLKSKSVQDRTTAAASLSAHGDSTAVPVLIDLLSVGEDVAISEPPLQVWQLALVELVIFTGKDLGLRDAKTVDAAIAAKPAWQEWWSRQGASLKWNPAQHRFVEGTAVGAANFSTTGSGRPLLIAGTLLAAAALTGGGTSFDSATNTFTVQVDLIGGDVRYEGWNGDVANAKADYEAYINDLWNQAFAKYAFVIPCSNQKPRTVHFKLDLQIHMVKPGGETPGHHHILFSPDQGVDGNHIFDPDTKNPNDDFTGPYRYGEDGQWTPAPPLFIAHEVGHLLGLGDDYVKDKNGKISDKAYDSRSNQTIMFKWTETFDQGLINRIGQQARKAGQLKLDCPPPLVRAGYYSGKIDGWHTGIDFHVALDSNGQPAIDHGTIGIPGFVCTGPNEVARGGGAKGGGVLIGSHPIVDGSFSGTFHVDTHASRFDVTIAGTFGPTGEVQGTASYSKATPDPPLSQCTWDTQAITWLAKPGLGSL